MGIEMDAKHWMEELNKNQILRNVQSMSCKVGFDVDGK
ncbi:hypothetical protein A0O32_0286 [Anoxybacillus flavithermus]|nr:hypothetical protein A0O32_0286 [Anoxybacillus flavithermus]